MKKILFFYFLCFALTGFSQIKPAQTAVTDAQTSGYVDGIRIDNLIAEYATFEWGAERLFFDYGQSGTRKKTTVTDKKGEPLMFARHSLSFTLNFLYFNGWELKQAYYNEADKTDMLIMKKRHEP